MRADALPARGQAGPPDATPAEPRPPPAPLSLYAKAYLAGVYGLAVGAAAFSVAVRFGPPGIEALIAFGLLAPLTAATQLFKVDAPNRHSYHATPAFLLAATLLLEPPLLVSLVVLAMLPEWLKYRYPWYIQLFNIATYLVNVLGAWAVLHTVAEANVLATSWRSAAATGLAAATFTTLNHAMVVLVLRLARGIGVRESGILTWESLGTDMALLCVGAAMATLWTVSPPLIALAIAPLLLFYRALFVPQLREEAHYDAKTGLLTPRRSLTILNEEISRIQKAPRPTSVIMADLDLLRNVNNSLGHLAGDGVLREVAGVLHRSLRSHDVVGRFGGEEFVILLRNTDTENALRAAERVRAAVEATTIYVTDAPEPVRVTMSLGVAAFPDPCPDPERLLYHADMAVYRSKLNGRNRVTLASPGTDDLQSDEGSYGKTLESVAGVEGDRAGQPPARRG